MVAKSQLKLIKKLHQKKYRTENKLFFVEGIKVVNELVSEGLKSYLLLATNEKLNSVHPDGLVEEIAETDLQNISALKTQNGVLGVFHYPENDEINYKDWIVALDSVQDPGNLGTIIRLCDWFGVKHLVCSKETVDCYNPKVLQATMGSIVRVNVHYLDLDAFLTGCDVSIFGTYMDEDSVYGVTFNETGVLLMGNEAKGISPSLEKFISKKITIPQFGNRTAESLNVAMATGILLNEIRRD